MVDASHAGVEEGAWLASRERRMQLLAETRAPGERSRERLRRHRRLVVEAHNNGWLGVEFQKTIAAEEVPAFDTLRLHHRCGRIQRSSRLRILFFHGTTGRRSNTMTMRTLLRAMTEPRGLRRTKTMRTIHGMPSYVPACGEAVELPGHGVGPHRDATPRFEDRIEWHARYLAEARAETPGMTLLGFARSGSGPVITEALKHAPGALDGLILMSPPLPGVPEVAARAVETRNRLIASRLLVVPEVEEWDLGHKLRVRWDEASFPGAPTLILTGASDKQVLPEERACYERLARGRRDLRYVDVPGAGHDVIRFSDEDQASTLYALACIYAFIRTVVPIDETPSDEWS